VRCEKKGVGARDGKNASKLMGAGGPYLTTVSAETLARNTLGQNSAKKVQRLLAKRSGSDVK